MVGTPPHPCSATYPTSDSDSRIRVGVPWPPTQPHRSKLLCHCAVDHDEACGRHPSDVVVLGVNHPLKEHIMFDQALVENINLILVAIGLFLVVPLLIGLFIDVGQGEDE